MKSALRHVSQREEQSGFTLVELLVALLVFSLLSIFAYRALNLLADSRWSVATEAELLSDMQKFLLLWERDMRQADWRTPDYTDAVVILDDSNALDAVGSNHIVRYFVREGVIYRQLRSMADAGVREAGLPVLSGINVMTVSFSGRRESSDSGVTNMSVIGLTLEQNRLGRIHKLILMQDFVLASHFSSLDDPEESFGEGEGGSSSEENTEIPAAY
ncbi:MAG TPA: prepilin-type N-terminal cleavage/methylation domain-containing protein [Thiolinea sp.]|nr:prepilin-type N-terminal cleavage/methylation domain-containing protein [Thiolinea sp.]